MPLPLLALVAPMIIGGIQSAISNNRANNMSNDISNSLGTVTDIMNNREPVYDASGKIRDMKSMVTNPYANLGVATQAAEMQIEQSDLALANTLDTIAQSGLGGGGATALAQAASRSKKGVSASIEQQEAQNQKLRAEGEQQRSQALMNIESQAISAEERASQGEDARVQNQLDRAYGEYDFLRSRQMGLQDAGNAAMMAGVSGSASLLTGALGTEGGGLSFMGNDIGG
tara:strand:- start:2706 stop:3392 length:687 start_codon:yes stop_codon:yes gene_type:complete